MSVSLYGSGQTVIQVVQGVLTTQASTTSTTFVTTGLSVSITPQSSTSKILVTVNGVGQSLSTNYCFYTIYRGATNLAAVGFNEISSSSVGQSLSICFLDSPATTSATTYALYFKVGSSTGYVNDTANSMTSTITVQEISGS